MITGEVDAPTKDQSALNAFVERSASRLASVRNGILIFGQDNSSTGDIELSLRSLGLLRRDALENDQSGIVELSVRCERSINAIILSEGAPDDIGRSLDLVAGLEEKLLKIPLDSDDFLEDISGFVDQSFDLLKVDEISGAGENIFQIFDIDEETLEIFRSEAIELVTNISENIRILSTDPDDREALWEIRRNAHTFKGAAGIVGQKAASALAHRIEDLLDKIVESNAAPGPETVGLLARASKRLEVFALGTDFDEEVGPLESLYAEFERVINQARQGDGTRSDPTGNSRLPAKSPKAKPRNHSNKEPSNHIVRISLDRLDHLIKLSQVLEVNRSMIENSLEELCTIGINFDQTPIAEELIGSFQEQKELVNEIRDQLLQIRMVRFGTLETRLNRAIHVTCQEENKKAIAIYENSDCEIDTQVIDSMIEPLLHLLKNAVVHGIETEETRRLIGKSPKGQISIRIDSDESGITLSVSDDGRGISATRLKQKAIQNAIITAEHAELMSEEEALELIFQRGLTTAESINLNAGRGVGMSIVRESVESIGGTIRIRSEAQKGTTFIIKMPLVIGSSRKMGRQAEVNSGAGPSGPNGLLILIVDDSAIVRRQSAGLIESAGHRAITAVNGAEAMELLLSNVWRPDLILSDVEMPVMDGWQLLECLKNTESLCDIPVVMATSLSDEAHVQLAIELGASDYKIKPLQPKDIEGIISDVLTLRAA